MTVTSMVRKYINETGNYRDVTISRGGIVTGRVVGEPARFNRRTNTGGRRFIGDIDSWVNTIERHGVHKTADEAIEASALLGVVTRCEATDDNLYVLSVRNNDDTDDVQGEYWGFTPDGDEWRVRVAE